MGFRVIQNDSFPRTGHRVGTGAGVVSVAGAVVVAGCTVMGAGRDVELLTATGRFPLSAGPRHPAPSMSAAVIIRMHAVLKEIIRDH
jgi:predicted small secreted protein